MELIITMDSHQTNNLYRYIQYKYIGVLWVRMKYIFSSVASRAYDLIRKEYALGYK